MTLKNIRHIAIVTLVAAASVCVGCHSDNSVPVLPEEPEVPVELDPEQLMLCLNVSFDNSGYGTRAENDPDGYEDPTGDFEKISTLRVIIVRELNEDKTQGIVEANRLVMTNDAGKPLYDNLEFKVIANENKRIYLIANEQFLTPPWDFMTSTDPTATKFLDTYRVQKDELADLTRLTNWTVSLPGITAATETITTGLFSPSPSRRLPLTEFFDVEVKRENEIDNTSYSHLFMTRAAAKAMFYLNVSDNFEGQDVENTYIADISLKGVGTSEYVFPNKAEYAPKSKSELISVSGSDIPANAPRKEMYIDDFSVPADCRQVSYLINGVNAEIKKTEDGPVAITSPIYFPESILDVGENYIVGVRLSNGDWLYAPLNAENVKHNILTIKGEDGDKDAIARNTFLPIELNFSGTMDLTVNVLPWNREDYYVDFSANIGFNDGDYLTITGTEGQAGDYLLLDRTTAQLVLNYGKVARGRFFISSPLASTWDAYLITTGGTTDAIQFQIPDPTDSSKTITTTHISGKVGVDEANFGIVATVAPGNEQNSAQLMVIVTLANGTPVVADVIGRNWNSSADRLTIIENPI